MKKYILKAKNIFKTYPGPPKSTLLKDISFNLEKGKSFMVEEKTENDKGRLAKENAQEKVSMSIARKIYRLISSAFEHRARLVDSICLILLIEMFSGLFISWIIFLMFLTWQFVVFAVNFCKVAKGGTAENLRNKMTEIF